MALSNLNNAIGYTRKVGDDEDVNIWFAVNQIASAISALKDYASLNEIELREGMKT